MLFQICIVVEGDGELGGRVDYVEGEGVFGVFEESGPLRWARGFDCCGAGGRMACYVVC